MNKLFAAFLLFSCIVSQAATNYVPGFLWQDRSNYIGKIPQVRSNGLGFDFVNPSSIISSNAVLNAATTNQTVYSAMDGMLSRPVGVYNTFLDLGNTFSVLTNYSEGFIRSRAQYFATNGQLTSGALDTIGLDDGWQRATLDGSGNLVISTNFTDFTNLVSYIHSLGFKALIYTSFSPTTCLGFPGTTDALVDRHVQQFANWGFDFVRVDTCTGGGDYGTQQYERRAYRAFSNAILKTGRKMGFGFFQGNLDTNNPPAWEGAYEANVVILENTQEMLKTNLTQLLATGDYVLWSATHAVPHIRPGHYPFIGLIGDQVNAYGLPFIPTVTQVKAQISLLAMLSSHREHGLPHPNFISVLTNHEVNAVWTDSRSEVPNILSLYSNATFQIWTKRLTNEVYSTGIVPEKVYAIMLANANATNFPITLTYSDLGFSSGTNIYIRDLWAGTNVGIIQYSWTHTVPSNTVEMFQFSKSRDLFGNGAGITHVASVLNEPTTYGAANAKRIWDRIYNHSTLRVVYFGDSVGYDSARALYNSLVPYMPRNGFSGLGSGGNYAYPRTNGIGNLADADTDWVQAGHYHMTVGSTFNFQSDVSNSFPANVIELSYLTGTNFGNMLVQTQAVAGAWGTVATVNGSNNVAGTLIYTNFSIPSGNYLCRVTNSTGTNIVLGMGLWDSALGGFRQTAFTASGLALTDFRAMGSNNIAAWFKGLDPDLILIEFKDDAVSASTNIPWFENLWIASNPRLDSVYVLTPDSFNPANEALIIPQNEVTKTNALLFSRATFDKFTWLYPTNEPGKLSWYSDETHLNAIGQDYTGVKLVEFLGLTPTALNAAGYYLSAIPVITPPLILNGQLLTTGAVNSISFRPRDNNTLQFSWLANNGRVMLNQDDSSYPWAIFNSSGTSIKLNLQTNAATANTIGESSWIKYYGDGSGLTNLPGLTTNFTVVRDLVTTNTLYFTNGLLMRITP